MSIRNIRDASHESLNYTFIGSDMVYMYMQTNVTFWCMHRFLFNLSSRIFQTQIDSAPGSESIL